MGIISAGISFSSELFEHENNLLYYNYRYYIPLLGRWLSRDPIINLIETKTTNEHNPLFSTMLSDYIFIVNTMINETDYLGLLAVHGNWCGPNWTGGFKKPWNRLTQHQKKDVKETVDTVDSFCKNHDKMYGRCERNHSNNECNYLKCLNKADEYLVNAIIDYLIDVKEGNDTKNISTAGTLKYNLIMNAVDAQRIRREKVIRKRCECP